MVLFEQNNFRLNKTGLHMVDTWQVHRNSTLKSEGCLDVTASSLLREHGEPLSDWLSVAVQKWLQVAANALAKCLNHTEIIGNQRLFLWNIIWRQNLISL